MANLQCKKNRLKLSLNKSLQADADAPFIERNPLKITDSKAVKSLRFFHKPLKYGKTKNRLF